jgi:CMP-N,N'-diacetyllegionaminic acid synthase
MSTLCIIPARAGSKGLPGKNIIDFAGRPLIQWPLLYVQKSALDCDILVYTDGEDIAQAANEVGDVCPFLRPTEISLDTTTTEETLRQALIDMEAFKKRTYENVLFLTCTEVFRDERWLHSAYDLMRNKSLDTVFVADQTYKNFWSSQKDSAPQRLDPIMKVHGNRQEKDPLFQENSGLLCLTRANVIKKGFRIGDNVEIIKNKTIPFNADIHTHQDLQYANLLLSFYRQYDKEITRLFEAEL